MPRGLAIPGVKYSLPTCAYCILLVQRILSTLVWVLDHVARILQLKVWPVVPDKPTWLEGRDNNYFNVDLCFLNCICVFKMGSGKQTVHVHCNTSVEIYKKYQTIYSLLSCLGGKYSYLCFLSLSHSLKRKCFLSHHILVVISQHMPWILFLSILLRFPELEILLNIFLVSS